MNKKKYFIPIIILLAIASLAFFQQYARRLFPVFTSPATPCTRGSIYYHMLNDQFLICTNDGIEEVAVGDSGAIPIASATVTGRLLNTDWVLFNSKQNALGFTPENSANKNASNGYAGLSSGKVSNSQLSEVLSSTDLLDIAATSGTGATLIRTTISGVTTNDVLKWSGTNWINQALLFSHITGTIATNQVIAGGISNSRCLRIDSSGNIVVAAADCGVGGGSGDMLLAGIQTVTGAKTFDPTKLIIGGVSSDPSVVVGSFYRDTDDNKLYWGVDSSTDFWGEVFIAGLSVVNLASANVTGILPIANGGTGQSTQITAFNALDPLTTKGDIIVHDGTNSIRLAVGTNGQCIKANSATASGLEYGTCSGGGSGDFVGPASSTDNAIVRFDGTTGKLGQNSIPTIDDSGNISTSGNISLGVGGTDAGFLELIQGNAPSLGTNSVKLYVPTSVTSYALLLPSAASSGVLKGSNSANVITLSIAAVNLASSDITGTLGVSNGGTGLATLTANNVILGNGTSTPNFVAPGTSGNVLTSNGTTWTSAAPSGGGAPTDATYITQTSNGTLTNEQALSSLSSGIMRVATSTGVITSLTDSAGIIANISDETGTGSLVFNNTPTIVGLIISNNATLPTAALGKLAVDTDDNKLYYASDGSTWGEVFVAGLSLVNLTSNVTGTLPVANGGTGATTLTGILQGNGTSAFTTITNSTTVGQILRVTGSNTYVFGALDLADSDAITGTLPFGNGGLGITSGTSGGIPYFSSSSSIASSAALTANLPIFGGGAGSAPVSGTRTGNTTQVATSTGAQTSGDLVSIDANGNHVASGFQIGQSPINSQSAAYTLVLSDTGKTILHPTADNNARTFTIPANSSVAYPVGTMITFVNQINTVTISITTDTLTFAGTGTTGSRTLAAHGVCTIVKVSSTVWYINGTGLS